MPRYTDNDIRAATDVNLQEYLMSQGYELKKSDRKAMKLEGYGGLFIFEKGYHHFSDESSTGKGNAIHFCRNYLDMGFQDAVQALLDFQGIRREEELNPPTRTNSYQKKSSYQKPVQKKTQHSQNGQWENTQKPYSPQENQVKEQFYSPPREEYSNNSHEHSNIRPENFDIPLETFNIPPEGYGMSDDYSSIPPEGYGMQEDYSHIPPEGYGMQEDYSHIPPEGYEMSENHLNIPQETTQKEHGGNNSFSSQSQEEVVFVVPSMKEHDSYQQEKQLTRPPPQEFQKKAPLKPNPKVEEAPKEPMVLPPRSDDKSGYKSFLYLTQDRALDKDIVNDLMKQGKIFEATTQYQQ